MAFGSSSYGSNEFGGRLKANHEYLASLSEVIEIVENTYSFKIVGRVFNEAITVVETATRSIGRTLSEVVSVVASLSNRAIKSFSESFSVSDAISYLIKAVGRQLGRDKDTNTKYGTRL